MSFDAKIDELITAINANTAALQGAGKATPAADKPAKAAADKPTKTTPKPKTGEEVTAALEEVKAKFGAPAAKAIIVGCGFAKLAELLNDGSKNDEAYNAAKAKMAEEPAVEDEGM